MMRTELRLFQERCAQQALGHNSKAVHQAYAKHVEVTVPSLEYTTKIAAGGFPITVESH
jgi:hypothetical protein